MVFFGCLFIVEIDVKDDFLLKKEMLPCKNDGFVFEGKSENTKENCVQI